MNVHQNVCSIFSVITIKPSLGDTSMTGSPLSPGEVITIPIDWFTGRGKHNKHAEFIVPSIQKGYS